MEMLKKDRLEIRRRRDEDFIQSMDSMILNLVNLVNPVYLTSHGGQQ